MIDIDALVTKAILEVKPDISKDELNSKKQKVIDDYYKELVEPYTK